MARPLDVSAVLIMVMLCASWGLQQVAIKLALPEVAPVAQAAIRSLIALPLVWAWLRLRAPMAPAIPAARWPAIWAGVFFAAEFAVLYMALALTDAARVVLFLYTAPFWVVLGTKLVGSADRLPLSRLIGVAIAFAGVALALGPSSQGNWQGDALALLAGMLWGANTMVVKATALAREATGRVVIVQLVVSGVALTGVSLALGEVWQLPTGVVATASLAYQSFWVATVTLLAWFSLIARYSATRLSVFTFLTPLIGALFGWLILGEALTPLFLAALALVALGIVLVSWPSAQGSGSPQT